jgi:tetratricopeptide (TPR) repeat protein
MFSALRAWFEQRRALRELRGETTSGGAEFKRYFGERIDEAIEEFKCGNKERARSIWDEMYAAYPYPALFSVPALKLLLDLECFDEADALMQQGLKRSPANAHFAIGRARIAYRRGDFEQALRHAAVVRRWFGLCDGYTVAAACFDALGRHDKAESMLRRANRRFSDNLEAAEAYARSAIRRGDWKTAHRRWRSIERRFGDEVKGPLGVSECLRGAGLYGEAEEKAAEACRRFPKNPWAAVEFATIASARGDFDEAVRRWKVIQKDFPHFPFAYFRGAGAARRANQEAEADRMLGLGAERLRTNFDINLAYARNANRIGDPAAAAERWALVAERFPACTEARVRAAEAAAAEQMP